MAIDLDLHNDGSLLRHECFALWVFWVWSVRDSLLDADFGVEGEISGVDEKHLLFGIHRRNLMGVGVLLETDQLLYLYT